MSAQRYAIVTDSACDISQAELASWGVECVNLRVLDEDGNDLIADNDGASIEAFYDYLETHEELPTTSMPAPALFGDMYAKLAGEGYGAVLSLHMSEEMSGTVNSARLAAQSASIPVTCVNLRRNTLTEALLVKRAAQLRGEGCTLEEVVEHLEEIIPKSSVVFALDTLENLVKGGRMGKAANLVASVLDIKPILMVGQEGVVNPVSMAKSMKRAISKLTKKLDELVAEIGPLEGCMMHVRNPKACAALRDAIKEKGLDYTEVSERQVGPIIATHVGLGCVGFSYIPARR